jgi:orotidine-5'-phosphate decarboxylase
MSHCADRLLDACRAKGSVVCVGLDPMPEFMPPEVFPVPGRTAPGERETLDGVFQFCMGVLDAVAPYAAAVKPQSAYFEVFRGDGVEAYFNLVHEARSRGLFVIGDVKRGDIGSTSSAYARGHLAEIDSDDSDEQSTPDAITVSPFLGLDTIEPFIQEAGPLGKGLFVLVRTSNPGSALLQDALLSDGRTVSEKLADELAPLAARHRGQAGYSLIGAVVGATQPHTMTSLRARLPHSVFLLPGYGAQGATAEMTRAAFNDGTGAIVSASRSVLYAHRDTRYSAQPNWQSAVSAAARDMRDELNTVLGR